LTYGSREVDESGFTVGFFGQPSFDYLVDHSEDGVLNSAVVFEEGADVSEWMY
jgi:hypothetical protein